MDPKAIFGGTSPENILYKSRPVGSNLLWD